MQVFMQLIWVCHVLRLTEILHIVVEVLLYVLVSKMSKQWQQYKLVHFSALTDHWSECQFSCANISYSLAFVQPNSKDLKLTFRIKPDV